MRNLSSVRLLKSLAWLWTIEWQAQLVDIWVYDKCGERCDAPTAEVARLRSAAAVRGVCEERYDICTYVIYYIITLLLYYLHYHFANGTFVVLLWYKLNYSPFSSIFVVLCLFYHSVSGIFWDFDGNSNK